MIGHHCYYYCYYYCTFFFILVLHGNVSNCFTPLPPPSREALHVVIATGHSSSSNSNSKHHHCRHRYYSSCTTNLYSSNVSEEEMINNDDKKMSTTTPSLSSSSTTTTKKTKTFKINISYENQNTTITVHPNETILNALERHKQQQQQQQTFTTATATETATTQNNNSNFLSTLTSLPQECRRGNCLTCTARHLPQSNPSSIITIDDGLSPHIKTIIQERGFVPTCSSYVIDDGYNNGGNGNDDGSDTGVFLEIGVCDTVWDSIWGESLNDCRQGEKIRNEAMAKCMRKASEKNVSKWVEKTERMLEK